MEKEIKNGTKKDIDGKPCIYYDGYWIRRYELQTDSLTVKKRTIDQLTRRVFHHVEPGINTPGYRLDEIRKIYEEESDPARKRVKGGMLAGALLNRGRDILTTIVSLEESGVKIETDNDLLKECGKCFLEALELGKNIKLANGGEGLNELWGEPFKAFSVPMDEFFQSRYIKVAQTMSEIDQITDILIKIINQASGIEEIKPKIIELGESAKLACETLRSDPVNFEIWPRYVAAKESFEEFVPQMPGDPGSEEYRKHQQACELIREGGSLLLDLSIVRVPMPKSMQKFFERCNEYLDKCSDVYKKRRRH